jgi:hypothetical protein
MVTSDVDLCLAMEGIRSGDPLFPGVCGMWLVAVGCDVLSMVDVSGEVGIVGLCGMMFL